jgi:hypothetical protein
MVLEIGYDTDCSEEVRSAFIEASGNELVDEDYSDPVDAVIVWFRNDDDDLVELLMDAIAPLTENGVIWLMTPKPNQEGHVEPADIADAAPSAGLQVTKTLSASKTWQGTRLVTRKIGKR